MLNYNLAKQLKDAGFPQKLRIGYFFPFASNEDTREKLYFPTLSELIEACLKMGDKNNKSLYIKLVCSNPDPSSSIYSYGVVSEGQSLLDADYYLSPEESMAIHWLNLNKQI